jgi:superfamily II DNA/RNA helicase
MQKYFNNLQIDTPTEMQKDFILNSSAFSILLSDTGSGKTFAFLVRLAVELKGLKENDTVLILSPTRELASQLFQEFKKLKLDINSTLCYGGHSFRNEKMQLSASPSVIISTPGRILDHYQRATEGLKRFNKLIIDEYDKTLEFGFLNELTEIFKFSKAINYIHLVSATEIQTLPDFISNFEFKQFSYLQKSQLKLNYFTVEAKLNDKLHALALLLSTFENQTSIVFCNHRDATERISEHLVQYGKEHVVFHGGLDQEERERAVVKFKNGTVDCILATDLASRGLDIPEVNNIIHYQFPQKLEDYTHRNGRTARMNAEGTIFLIHSEKEPLPIYLKENKFISFKLPEKFNEYSETKMLTLFLNVGRKQKIRKTDIVGFLTNNCNIDFKEIGQILVYDSFSYIAITKNAHRKYKNELSQIKIKKMNAKISICR